MVCYYSLHGKLTESRSNSLKRNVQLQVGYLGGSLDRLMSTASDRVDYPAQKPISSPRHHTEALPCLLLMKWHGMLESDAVSHNGHVQTLHLDWPKCNSSKLITV